MTQQNADDFQISFPMMSLWFFVWFYPFTKENRNGALHKTCGDVTYWALQHASTIFSPMVLPAATAAKRWPRPICCQRLLLSPKFTRAPKRGAGARVGVRMLWGGGSLNIKTKLIGTKLQSFKFSKFQIFKDWRIPMLFDRYSSRIQDLGEIIKRIFNLSWHSRFSQTTTCSIPKILRFLKTCLFRTRIVFLEPCWASWCLRSYE